jgi:hypothetical protein
MEILRVPPYPLVTTWDVPDADANYVIELEDLVDHSIEIVDVVSNSSSKIVYELPQSKVQFDRNFAIRIYDTTDLAVVDSNLNVYRPYVDPNTLGTIASEIAEYKMLEIVARAIIDEFTNDGFYNHKLIVQGVGNNTDYYPLWHETNRVLKVYENNVMVYNSEDRPLEIASFYDVAQDVNEGVALTTTDKHGYVVGNLVDLNGFSEEFSELNSAFRITEIIDDYSFRISKAIDDYSLATSESVGTSERVWYDAYAVTLDNSAIYKTYTDRINRYQSAPISLPASNGDLGFASPGSPAFQRDFDYTFILDAGYKAIPPEIEYAAKLLIEDIKCGKMEYYKRYITSYNTDQFKIQFDKKMLEGTGNIIVDKILSKYVQTITRFGVL